MSDEKTHETLSTRENHPHNAKLIQRMPFAYTHHNAADVNRERLPELDEVREMELSYRSEPRREDVLRSITFQQVVFAIFVASLIALSVVLFGRVIPLQYLIALAATISGGGILIDGLSRALTPRKLTGWILGPICVVLVFTAATATFSNRMLGTVIMGVIFVPVLLRQIPLLFSFNEDWLWAHPRLKPETRKTRDNETYLASPALGIGLATMAFMLPTLSQSVAFAALVGGLTLFSLVGVPNPLVKRKYAGFIDLAVGTLGVVTRYMHYGERAAVAPGVWHPRTSPRGRSARMMLTLVVTSIFLTVSFAGFFPWDMPFVKSKFMDTCTERISRSEVLLESMKVLFSNVDWDEYPELEEPTIEGYVPSRRVRENLWERNPIEIDDLRDAEIAKHLEEETERLEYEYTNKRDEFFEEVIRKEPFAWAYIAGVGISAGEFEYLWAFLFSMVACLVIPPWALILFCDEPLRRLRNRADHIDGLDSDGRPEWQWYVDRVRLSQHEARGRTGNALRESDHMFAGIEPRAQFPVLLDRKLLSEHCYIVGQTGSGKTALGISPLLLQLMRGSGEDSSAEPDEQVPLVILDLKGDPALFNTVKEEAEARGQKFRFFTPEQARTTHIFNPFQNLAGESRTLIQLCQLILDALGLNHGEGYGRSYYSRQNREALYDALDTDPRPETFQDLYEVLQSFRGRPHYQDIFELVSTIHALTHYSQLATFEPIQNPDDVIHMPRVLEECEVAYFWLPSAMESISVREIGKLAVYSMLAAAIERQQQGKPFRQAYLVVDEFQRLASENFKIVLEQARSYGIGTILANQTQSDLKTPSVDLRPTVRTNTRVKMYFAVSDPSEIQDLSTMSGEEMAIMQSQTYSYTHSIGSSSSDTFSETTKPRLTVNDIIRVGDHPTEFILQVARGSGYTQFGGLPVIVRSAFPMSEDDYERRFTAPWPEDEQGTIVPQRDYRDIDAERTKVLLDEQNEAMRKVFDEVAGVADTLGEEEGSQSTDS